MDAFLSGVIAGYGIAIPVGAIAILVVRVGIRCGFGCGVAAGAGAATADLLYATLAVVGGGALATMIDTAFGVFRVVSGSVLIVIAVVGLRNVRRSPSQPEFTYPGRSELARTYSRFLGLTIINPTTIVYFAAVVIGLGMASSLTVPAGVAFVVGAFLASLSWQTLLAAIGAFARDRLNERSQRVAVVVGNLMILGLALAILIP